MTDHREKIKSALQRLVHVISKPRETFATTVKRVEGSKDGLMVGRLGGPRKVRSIVTGVRT